MATQAQITANRQNAQSSTGAKTQEGKAASSRNATKHGLSSSFNVLAHENQDEFDALLNRLEQEHKPSNHHQVFLVGQLGKTWWLLCRAQRLEAKAFDHMAGAGFDEDDADGRIVTQMFKTNPNAYVSLQRYATQAERSYYKAYRELKAAKQIQNEADYIRRIDQDHSPAAQRIMTAPVPNHPAYADPQYGHLSENEAARLRQAVRQNEPDRD